MSYKIIDRAIMPDGTEIYLEDWSKSNSQEYPDVHGMTIGAYPIARRTSKGGFIRGGERFRLTIAMNSYSGYSNDMVKADYKALKRGKKKLEDLAEHFWDGDKDAWLLGMNAEDYGRELK